MVQGMFSAWPSEVGKWLERLGDLAGREAQLPQARTGLRLGSQCPSNRFESLISMVNGVFLDVLRRLPSLDLDCCINVDIISSSCF